MSYVLPRQVDSFFWIRSSRPMNWTDNPSISPKTRCAHACSKVTPEIAVIRSIRFGGTPNCTTLFGITKPAALMARPPKPNALSVPGIERAFSLTPCEFSNSINSRKPLLIGIGIDKLAELQCQRNSLLGRHAQIGRNLGGIRFLKAMEDANRLFQRILPDCTARTDAVVRARRRATS